jgi:hypothetical protein
VCYEANRAYCATIGDDSQPAWTDLPDQKTESSLDGVAFVLANPDAPDSAQHDQLSPEQRVKDRLFRAIVKSFMTPTRKDTP